MKRRNRLDILSDPLPWRSFILIIVSGSLAVLGIFVLNPARAQALSLGEMPVALHSKFAADYSADLRGYVLPPVSIEIVDQIIEENAMSQQEEIQSQVERVHESLQHPVPTVPAPTKVNSSPQPTTISQSVTPTPVPTNTAVPTFTAVLTATSTWVVSSPTPTAVEEHATARPTQKKTQPPTLSPTVTFSPTFMPTKTSNPTWTATLSITATKTMRPPSATPCPTETQVPSSTAVPQTATPDLPTATQPSFSVTLVPSALPTQVPTQVPTLDWIQSLIDTYCPIVENEIPSDLWPMLDRLRELCAEAGY